MEKVKSKKGLTRLLIVIIGIAVMLITATAAHLFAPVSRNNSFLDFEDSGNTNSINNSAYDYSNMYLGEGVCFDFMSGMKRATDTYGWPASTTATEPYFQQAASTISGTPTVVLKYKMRAGELVSDTFLVHTWGSGFYPAPDADVIGIEQMYNNRNMLIRFYARMPGITECKLGNWEGGYGSGSTSVATTERGVTIIFEVLPNLDELSNNKINTGSAAKIGTILNRTFAPADATTTGILLSQIVSNPNDCEIIAVGDADNSGNISGCWGYVQVATAGLTLYNGTTTAQKVKGQRYDNTSVKFLYHTSTIRRYLEIVVRHKATGKIDFIPIKINTDGRDENQLRYAQAYVRTKYADSTTGAEFNVADLMNKGAPYTNYFGFYPGDSRYINPTLATLSTKTNTNLDGSKINDIVKSKAGIAQMVSPFTMNHLTEGPDTGFARAPYSTYGWNPAQYFFTNNTNWAHAPSPKAYAGTAKGTLNGSAVTLNAGTGNATNYPTIELQGTKAAIISATDFTTTAVTTDVTTIARIHSYSYGIIKGSI